MHYIGFNSGDFARAGNALALSECNVKYTRPLRTRDVFNSLAWVTKVSATSFHLYQELVKVEEDEQTCKEEVSWGCKLHGSAVEHMLQLSKLLLYNHSRCFLAGSFSCNMHCGLSGPPLPTYPNTPRMETETDAWPITRGLVRGKGCL